MCKAGSQQYVCDISSIWNKYEFSRLNHVYLEEKACLLSFSPGLFQQCQRRQPEAGDVQDVHSSGHSVD